MYTFALPLDRALATAAGSCAVVCQDNRRTYAELGSRCRRLAGALARARPGTRRPGRRHRPELRSLSRALPRRPGRGLRAGPGQLAAGSRGDAGHPGRRRGQRAVRRRRLSGCCGSQAGADHARRLRGSDRRGRRGRIWATGWPRTTWPPCSIPPAPPAPRRAQCTPTGAWSASALHFMATWPFDRQTRWLVASPMFHTGGIIGTLATVWAGGTHVIMPRFDPDLAVDLIEREAVTHTLLVPTMLAAAASAQLARPRDVSSLRYLSHGASPISAETLRKARIAFPGAELLHVYGTTEATPITTLLPHEELILDTPRIRSCGQPATGVEMRIVDYEPGRRTARPGRRDPRAQPQPHGRLLAEARGHGRGHARRLVPDRRPGVPGRRVVHLPGRPGQGHDRQRRREHLLHRGGGCPGQPSRRRGGRGLRRPRPALGRVGLRGGVRPRSR